MARRRRPEKREILPDPKFGDEVLSKFMNSVMLDGKKSVAEGIVYSAMETVETRAKKDPLGVFHDALNNVKPGIEVRSRRVGDWQMRCEQPAGAQSEQCAVYQNIVAEDRPNLSLLVIALRTADKKSQLLRVVAPLGVLLPSGLGLRIDQADIGRAAFMRCVATGCIAEAVIDDKLAEQLRTGQQATFIVFQTPEEGIGIPVSLSGFGQAFDSLPK